MTTTATGAAGRPLSQVRAADLYPHPWIRTDSPEGKSLKTLSTLVHQAVISANTLLTTICLAHLLGAHDFGVFATCFAGLLVGLGLNRCIVTDPAIITSGELDAPTPAAIRYVMLTRRRSWLVITVATTILWLGAAALTQHLYLLVGAVGVPLVMAADTVRYVDIAMDRKRQARLSMRSSSPLPGWPHHRAGSGPQCPHSSWSWPGAWVRWSPWSGLLRDGCAVPSTIRPKSSLVEDCLSTTWHKRV